MKAIPFDKAAYKLLHEGAIALAQVEANGMRVDVDYLDRAILETGEKIREKRAAVQGSEVVKVWKKHFRGRYNLDSHEQLGKVLFELMEFDCPNLTESGRYSTDAETLATVDHPFVHDYLLIQKLQKAKTTYLEGIRDEVVDGLLRPTFNLNLVKTFRSSSDSPNFQNIPVRDADISKLVRAAIVAREGRRIVELDYRGIEVCIAACYHKDPTMISYIEDKTKDMHRDTASEVYLLPQGEVTKNARYCAKNKFVFPQFYGSYWAQCAPDLWNAIDQMKLDRSCWKCVGKPGAPHGCSHCKGTGRRGLKAWLKHKGIAELGNCRHGESPEPGTFAYHVRKIERDFWGRRFPVYAQWKKDWYEAYKKLGWVLTKTGFVLQGFMKRNEVINYPVQGSAFHCLLWSLTQLQLRELKREGLEKKALQIGQIHDSSEADVVDGHVNDYVRVANRVMTRDLVRHWPQLGVVPLEIEAEVTPVDGNWTEKEPWKVPSASGGRNENLLEVGDEAVRRRFKEKRTK